MPPVVMTAADDNVTLVPDDERAWNEAAGVEPTSGYRNGKA